VPEPDSSEIELGRNEEEEEEEEEEDEEEDEDPGFFFADEAPLLLAAASAPNERAPPNIVHKTSTQERISCDCFVFQTLPALVCGESFSPALRS